MSCALAIALAALPAAARAWPAYPGIQPAKDATPAEVAPGDEITWTITIANDVGAGEASVYVTDDVPDPADGAPVTAFDIGTVSAPMFASMGYGGDILGISNVYVQPGATATISFRTRVAAGAPDGATICNQAFVRYLVTTCSGGVPPLCQDANYESRTRPTGGTSASPTCVTVRRPVTSGPDLRDASKTVRDASGNGIATPGELLTWTIEVPNVGAGPADGVIVTDRLDAALIDVDAPLGTVIPGPPTSISWSLGSIPVGSSAIATFTARLACDAAGTTICNQATIEATGIGPIVTDDPSTTSPNDPTCLDVGAPDLSAATATATETSGDGLFAAGEEVQHAITLRNDGLAPALNIVVTQPIDPLVSVTDPGTGTLAPGPPATITWRLPFLYPSDVVTLPFRTRIAAAAPDRSTVAMQASVTSDEMAACASVQLTDDPATPAADDATAFVVDVPRFGLVTKTVADGNGDGVATPGESLTWRILVENGGRLALTDIRIADSFDPGVLSLVDAGGGIVSGPGAVEWTIGRLDAGGTVVMTLETTLACATAAPVACNQASVTAPGPGPRATDDPSTLPVDDATCIATGSVDLSRSTKEAVETSGDGIFAAGEEVVYTLTIRNDGNVEATDVAITDAIEPSLRVTDPGSGILLPGPPESIEWTVPALPVGARVGLVFRARIDPAAAAGTRIANRAFAATAEGLACSLVAGTDDPSSPAPGDATEFTVGSATPPIDLLRELVDSLAPTPTPPLASLLIARCATRGSCPDCAVPGVRARTLLLGGLPASGTANVDGDAMSGSALAIYELSGSDSCLLVARVDSDGDGARDDIRISW